MFLLLIFTRGWVDPRAMVNLHIYIYTYIYIHMYINIYVYTYIYICPTVQHSGTSNMSYCAAQWHKQYVLLCFSSENINEREWTQPTLSSFCDVTQQPDKEPKYVCMSVLLKMAANETLQNVSVIVKKQTPPRNYLQSPKYLHSPN